MFLHFSDQQILVSSEAIQKNLCYSRKRKGKKLFDKNTPGK